MALLILGLLLVTLIEVPGMRTAHQRGEMWAFGVLLATAFALGLAVVQGWPVPSPLRLLADLLLPGT